MQNPHAFEFSTFYLVLLVDNQFVTSLYTREKQAELEANKKHPLVQNPIYAATSEVIGLNAHISQLRLFTTLFFRQLKSSTFHPHTPELMFQNELQSRMLL